MKITHDGDASYQIIPYVDSDIKMKFLRYITGYSLLNKKEEKSRFFNLNYKIQQYSNQWLFHIEWMEQHCLSR